jgi:hypothetical protein
MRLGIKTDDVFLIELNEKNQLVQNLFLEKIKKITKKYSIDVMLQDGTIKKQQTFDVQKIDNLYKNITEKLKDWSEHGISQTNNEDIRRNFVKLVTSVENYQILLHLSIQYHVLLFYQTNYEVIKKQKELADFMDTTKNNEEKLKEKSDKMILEKLRAEGYKNLDTENLFDIFFRDDKIREKIMSEIETQTDGELQKIIQHKQELFKNLDDLLLEVYQIEPVLIDETRLVSGEEGCVCNIDIERVENNQKTGSFDSNNISVAVKDKIKIKIGEILESLS